MTHDYIKQRNAHTWFVGSFHWMGNPGDSLISIPTAHFHQEGREGVRETRGGVGKSNSILFRCIINLNEVCQNIRILMRKTNI
jgi:hypothetical protein